MDYNEKVISDEMQRAVSYELVHNPLWLWYVLISFTMPPAELVLPQKNSRYPPRTAYGKNQKVCDSLAADEENEEE